MKRALFILVALAAAAGCSSADSAREIPSDGGGGGADASTTADTGMDATTSSSKDGGADVAQATDSMAKDGPQEAPSDDVDDFGKRKDGATADAGCTIPDPDAGPGGALNFAENFGKTGGMSPACVAIAPSTGNIVIGGGFTGTVNFGGGLKTSHDIDAAEPGADTFVAMYDSSGAYQWAKTFGNGTNTGANGVAVDGSGNVAMAGIFAGVLKFGCKDLTAAGDSDVFVVVLDSAGSCVWSKSFGAVGQYQGLDSVAFDPSGDLLIAGEGTSVSFGGGSLTGYYIAKFGPKGIYKWSEAFDATCDESIPTLAVDGEGNAVLAGCFVGSTNFGGGLLKTTGYAAFVAKFDSSGTYQWAKQYGSGAAASSVATDSCGNIFVLGNFGKTINFGTGTLTANPVVENAFLAKIGPKGVGAWADQFEASNADGLGAGSIAVDGAGGVTATFGLSGSVNFGGGTLSSNSSGSVAIASFGPSGIFRWSYAGGPPSTAPGSYAGDPQGVAASGSTVAVVGAFGGSGKSLAFPGKTLTCASEEDGFLATFAP